MKMKIMKFLMLGITSIGIQHTLLAQQLNQRPISIDEYNDRLNFVLRRLDKGSHQRDIWRDLWFNHSIYYQDEHGILQQIHPIRLIRTLSNQIEIQWIISHWQGKRPVKLVPLAFQHKRLIGVGIKFLESNSATRGKHLYPKVDSWISIQ